MRHLASNLVSLLVVTLVVLAGVLAWGRYEFYREGPLDTPLEFVISRGETLGPISERLEASGAISSAAIFRIGVRSLDRETDFKFGEYELRAGGSMDSVLDALTSGHGIMHWVTIPEGFSVAQVIARLMETDQLDGEVTEIPLEGSLAPETYAISRGESRQSVIDRMKEAQDAILEEAWSNKRSDLPLESPSDVLILASIVEKETGVGSERAEVAAVFFNRLRKKWPLQSDPTVVYGLTLGQESLGRGLKQSELKKETPYNTYLIRGLPPTPIANPGRAAIEATVRPNDSKNMYFVADGSGGHVFAETLDQHNRNVAKWRRIERENGNR